MIQVACIIGTRPEAIKMSPVVSKLGQNPNFKVTVISTGQHQELMSMTSNSLELKVDIDLNVMKTNQTPLEVISTILSGLDKIFLKNKYDAVLVQGDTATAFAGGLGAYLNHIPVGHVEAGLRTYDLDQPWPEESMRQMLDRISTWCFAPTEVSKKNLLSEHVDEDKIFVTGNTIIDAAFANMSKLPSSGVILKQNGIKVSKFDYILVTGHRRENHGEAFHEVAFALRELALNHPSLDFIYPVHPNPNVKNQMEKELQGLTNVHLIKPLSYFGFLSLMKDCMLIISDSGGVQEEASVFHKPVILLREVTERPEGVSVGTTTITGCHKDKIIKEAEKILKNPPILTDIYPYGDGKTSERIVSILLNYFRQDR